MSRSSSTRSTTATKGVRQSRQARRSLPGSVWARMLRICLLLSAIAALVLALVAWIVAGTAALVSVAVGTVVVVVVFTLSLLALWWASRYPPALAGMVMLMTYVGLVFAGAIILFAAPRPQTLHEVWLGATTVVQLVAWLTGVAYAVRRTRLPIFDVETTVKSPQTVPNPIKDQPS